MRWSFGSHGRATDRGWQHQQVPPYPWPCHQRTRQQRTPHSVQVRCKERAVVRAQRDRVCCVARDSKLTRLVAEALGGRCKVCAAHSCPSPHALTAAPALPTDGNHRHCGARHVQRPGVSVHTEVRGAGAVCPERVSAEQDAGAVVPSHRTRSAFTLLPIVCHVVGGRCWR